MGNDIPEKTEFAFLQTYCDGVGNMLSPVKEQIEAMKSDIQTLKEAENESGFNSVTSGSPGKDERRKSPGDIPIISVEL